MLIEKIFQRDDKSFILFYHSFLSLILYLSSTIAYYIRNNTFELSGEYIEASIFIVIVFFILSIFTTKEKRYIKGSVQWLRVEFLLLIQTFILVILVTVIFKITDNYSRIWLFTNIITSSVLFLFFKVFFDYLYSQLVKSNIIQRNILLKTNFKPKNPYFSIASQAYSEQEGVNLQLQPSKGDKKYLYNLKIFKVDLTSI